MRQECVGDGWASRHAAKRHAVMLSRRVNEGRVPAQIHSQPQPGRRRRNSSRIPASTHTTDSQRARAPMLSSCVPLRLHQWAGCQHLNLLQACCTEPADAPHEQAGCCTIHFASR
jgi:hypothetical protein